MSLPSGEPPEHGQLPRHALPEEILAPTERERILFAMAAVCAERGYAETSIEEVASRAGLPREAFDKNFADKEQCALAALGLMLAETTAIVSAVYSEDSSLLDNMVGTARHLVEALAEQQASASLMHVQARQGGTDRMYRSYESTALLLASLLDTLRQFAPTDAPLPASAARGALGSAEALARREIAAGRPERLQRLIPDFVYGALVPFVGQEEALRYMRLIRGQLDDKR